MTSSPPAGLRERKKARTRASIREHAFRLFAAQGWAATTVDQIAEAAEVSQSTFFRYFPSKEELILTDDYDPQMIAAMRAAPPEAGAIEAVRLGIRAVFDRFTPAEWERERHRQRLLDEVPELRARIAQQYSETIGLLAAVVAERAGLPPGTFSARVLAGAVVGVAMATSASGSGVAPDLDAMDAALTLLEAGLPLRPDAPAA